MNRRGFLSLSAFTPFAHLLSAHARTGAAQPPVRELKADLVVVGAGVGGVACALAAARNGLQVLLTEETGWIGGQLTSQAVPPDEHPWIEDRGSTKTYRQFRTKVRDFYRRNYPLSEDAAKNPRLNPGNGSVSKLCHEPRVALAVLLEMLAPHITAGRVKLIQPFVPVRVETDGDTVTAVLGVAQNFGTRIALTAPYFVDATETGELLPLAKVEHVTGTESSADTREPHAPDRAAPGNHQAATVCFALDYEPDQDHTIDRPDSYKWWRDYAPKMQPAWPGNLLSWEMSDPVTLKPRAVGFDPTGPVAKGLNLWTYRRIVARDNFEDGAGVRDVCLVNWPQNDYWLGNLYDTADPAGHRAAARELSRCLLYWMQTEAPHPGGKKAGWKGLRLRGDVCGTDDGDGLAMAPYVRESRRIKALFTVTERHVGVEARAKLLGKKPGEFAAEPFTDSVGTGSYRIDLHPSTGGDNYIDVSSLPFQIPLGALIPERAENLLPACKNIGTTHITNGCYRLHPVEWSVGEAVGELVAFCTAKKRVPRQVRKSAELLTDFQAQLTKAGSDLAWPDNIAKTPR
ncbi:FAD-dependent oxidoreductase [Gemmata sp. JC673]|uniref:FAD-dependent oxidoreductase n=1 Tax=Gemmata algarum TaxID=2975278 RepID=A0ABU5EYI4_9BACT|nr:FAD-dependent oxidoreductase [Gemmata algarum]MDY3560373.1 FAD-dependent oxidoreductase [Gemmata algarum]